MIPSLNPGGVLPPFIQNIGVTQPAGRAPYKTSLTELAKQFGTTADRNMILRGLLEYRQQLRNEGIISGFQWIDGSFVEDCEKNRGRSPNDIDVVTFAERPGAYAGDKQWENFYLRTKGTLFDRGAVKTKYKCDAFYIDLNLPQSTIVSRTHYWFGLFSHQRLTYIWKGLLEISLQSDDIDVSKQLGVC